MITAMWQGILPLLRSASWTFLSSPRGCFTLRALTLAGSSCYGRKMMLDCLRSYVILHRKSRKVQGLLKCNIQGSAFITGVKDSPLRKGLSLVQKSVFCLFLQGERNILKPNDVSTPILRRGDLMGMPNMQGMLKQV